MTTIKTENEGVKAEEEEEEADVSLARWFIGSNRFSFPFAVLACAFQWQRDTLHARMTMAGNKSINQRAVKWRHESEISDRITTNYKKFIIKVYFLFNWPLAI